MASARSLRREIIRVCRRLYERGLISGLSGNVSARTGKGTILVTPAGAAKCDVTADELVETDMDGTVVSEGTPSTEIAMHTRIYALRPDVGAIVHAHPPAATGLALAGEGLPEDVIPELAAQLGTVPLVPYARSGSVELADAVASFVGEHQALLHANHGATTLGSTVEAAHVRMELLEHAAKTIIFARMAGRVITLSQSRSESLRSNLEKPSRGDRATGGSRPGR